MSWTVRQLDTTDVYAQAAAAVAYINSPPSLAAETLPLCLLTLWKERTRPHIHRGKTIPRQTNNKEEKHCVSLQLRRCNFTDRLFCQQHYITGLTACRLKSIVHISKSKVTAASARKMIT